MFTGIVQDIGEIVAVDDKGDRTITIATKKLPLGKTAVGASISCNGICLTVMQKADAEFSVRVSAETISKTTAGKWRKGTRINLEPALRMGDELGGHMVLGHIDATATLKSKTPDGDSMRYVFEVPEEFAKFIAPKGSVALDGVALTVNEVKGKSFGVNLIPHTLTETTLSGLQPGDAVNFESDLIARYTERLLSSPLEGEDRKTSKFSS
jgi:riboflavin synthase